MFKSSKSPEFARIFEEVHSGLKGLIERSQRSPAAGDLFLQDQLFALQFLDALFVSRDKNRAVRLQNAGDVARHLIWPIRDTYIGHFPVFDVTKMQ